MGVAPSQAGPLGGPLTGIKVIDLSAVVSGPMAAGLLAEQGADVIKVEPHQGDLTRDRPGQG
jgi:crotonobetainyl-CoA:carnitine CoA-transferase CaiB-like acyl-CoA transferase